LLLLAAALCIVLGLILLLGIIRGLPRLIIDRQGVVLRSATGSKSAAWDTLGAFSVVARAGRGGKQIRSASAPLFGPSGLSVGKTLSIPDAFQVPLTTIVADLMAMHGRASDPAASFLRATVAPERPIGVAGFRWPWLTAALFATFVLVFALEQRLAVTPGTASLTPSIATLLALGALSRPLVLSGEWYRLLTAPFLHGGLVHLVGNGIAFVLAGYALERLVGRAWMFCVFAGGALAGSLMSLALMGPHAASVGASGAIMAMLVALFMISFRLPSGTVKMQIQMQAARVVIPAVIPMLNAGAAIHIDYGAHFGGVLFGAALGWILLRTWRDDSSLPRFRSVAVRATVLAALACAGAAGAVAWRYPLYAVAARLIPRAMLPRDQNEMIAVAALAPSPTPRGRADQAAADSRGRVPT
jgi:membrane associated rhomboid family serine protease